VPAPVIVPRADHPISRRDIDSDALRVLYRLQQHGHVAYLVGGSVRDLMLGRRPKDFDIGTDAHPGQIKKLFRNCWIIGRRFRLAHIKFGQKTIEVATFRQNLPEGAVEIAAPEEPVLVASAAPPGALPPGGPATGLLGAAGGAHEPDAEPGEPEAPEAAQAAGATVPTHGRGRRPADEHSQIHRDNTFGTPEEDAFRRDFTVNALFYDVATRSIIDYVGGLGDLEQRVIRSIGDPKVRFVEDPVRMLRAAVLGARLGFDLDVLVTEAIAEQRGLIARASAARMLEEYFKILRSGYAQDSFRALGRVRLLELITPELTSPTDAVWDSLARLDQYRQRFPAAPPELTNAVLIGALLAPLGLLTRRPVPDHGMGAPGQPERVSFGMLPVARRDMDRLRQLMQTLPRMTDPELPPRVARGLPHRPSFADALVWLEIFGDEPDIVEYWKQLKPERPQGQREERGHGRSHQRAHPHPPVQAHAPAQGQGAGEGGEQRPGRRRRRRRRGRRRRPAGGET